MFRTSTIGRVLAASLMLGLAAGAAQAGKCGYEICFGAVATGADGIVARAGGHRTAPAARDRADRVCLGKCDRIEVFHSGCGALAASPGGQQGAGFGLSRRAAEAEALADCLSLGAGACFVRVWACSQ